MAEVVDTYRAKGVDVDVDVSFSGTFEDAVGWNQWSNVERSH